MQNKDFFRLSIWKRGSYVTTSSGKLGVINSAVYALHRFQEQMKGAGEAAGLLTEEDVAAWITASRREKDAE